MPNEPSAAEIAAAPEGFSIAPGQQTAPEASFADHVNMAMGGALDTANLSQPIAPLTAPSAARMAGYAGKDQPNPPTAPLDKPMPPDQGLVAQLPQNIRDQYRQSLLDGDTTGPQHFSEMLGGAAWGVADDLKPTTADDTHDQRSGIMGNAAGAVAGALPSLEDTIDYSAATAHQIFGQVDLDNANIVKRNMLDHWADTGEGMASQYQRAQTDPAFQAQLAKLPPRPRLPADADALGVLIGGTSAAVMPPETMTVPASWATAQVKGAAATIAGEHPDAIESSAGNMSNDPFGGNRLREAVGVPGIAEQQAQFDAHVRELKSQGLSDSEIAGRVISESPVASAFGVANIEGVGGGMSSFIKAAGPTAIDRLLQDTRGSLGPSPEIKGEGFTTGEPHNEAENASGVPEKYDPKTALPGSILLEPENTNKLVNMLYGTGVDTEEAGAAARLSESAETQWRRIKLGVYNKLWPHSTAENQLNIEGKPVAKRVVIAGQGTDERALKVASEELSEWRDLAKEGHPEQLKWMDDQEAWYKGHAEPYKAQVLREATEAVLNRLPELPKPIKYPFEAPAAEGAGKDFVMYPDGAPTPHLPGTNLATWPREFTQAEEHSIISDGVKNGHIPPPPVRPWQQQLVDFLDGLPVDHPGLLDQKSPYYQFADTLRQGYRQLRNRIEDETDADKFIDDYVRHRYIKSGRVSQIFGSGKSGYSGALRKRTIPTQYEAVSKGERPVHINQIDNILSSMNEMNHWLTKKSIVAHYASEEGSNIVQWAHRQPGPNYAPLHGMERLNPFDGKQLAWAPDGFASPFNKFYRPPWGEEGSAGAWAGKFVEGQRRINNAALSISYAGSQYHPWNIAQWWAAGEIAQTVGHLAHGDFATVLDRFAQAYKYGLGTGKRLRTAYLNPGDQSDPEMQRLAGIAARAGLQPDKRPGMYLAGHHASLSWKEIFNGDLGNEMSQYFHNLFNVKGLGPMDAVTHVAGQALHGVAETAGFVTDALSHYYMDIQGPLAQNGRFAGEMRLFLKLNPGATAAQIDAHAYKVASMVQSTFGEMNLDRLFMQPEARRIGQAISTSMGWKPGTWRNIAEGAREIVMGHPMGQYARNLYAYTFVASAIAYGFQKVMTNGEAPFNWMTNIMAPFTGGATPDHKELARAVLPGEQKEPGEIMRVVSNFWHGHFLGYGLGDYLSGWIGNTAKFETTLVKMALSSGGSPALHQEMREEITNFLPITTQMLMQQKKGSHLSPMALLMGIKDAGFDTAEPDEAAQALKRREANAIESEKYVEKLRHRDLANPDNALDRFVNPTGVQPHP